MVRGFPRHKNTEEIKISKLPSPKLELKNKYQSELTIK